MIEHDLLREVASLSVRSIVQKRKDCPKCICLAMQKKHGLGREGPFSTPHDDAWLLQQGCRSVFVMDTNQAFNACCISSVINRRCFPFEVHLQKQKRPLFNIVTPAGKEL